MTTVSMAEQKKKCTTNEKRPFRTAPGESKRGCTTTKKNFAEKTEGRSNSEGGERSKVRHGREDERQIPAKGNDTKKQLNCNGGQNSSARDYNGGGKGLYRCQRRGWNRINIIDRDREWEKM